VVRLPLPELEMKREPFHSQPITLVYDGSFDGFLTAVFEGIRLKLCVGTVVRQECYLPALFEEPRLVLADSVLAERVWNGLLAKSGADIAGLVRGAFLSGVSGIETDLWHYLRKLFADSSGMSARNVLDEHTHRVLATARKVSHEAHLLTGFLRFRKCANGEHVAVVEPQYDVLELLASHCVRRFPHLVWMIVDAVRGSAVRYDGIEVTVLQFDPAQLPKRDGKVELPAAADDMESLWLAYYKSVNIQERRNPKLMARLLPRKYWKYLPERQGYNASPCEA